MSRWINNLPIGVKAFAASAVLLMCVVGLGSNAFMTLTHWASGLELLSHTTLPEQNRLRNLRDRVSAVQLNVFRYVAWSNNGVNDSLLDNLRADISSELALIASELQTLAEEFRATPQDWQGIVADWKAYSQRTGDAMDIARADPPMGTMMLGGTDDVFLRVADALRELSDTTGERTVVTSSALLMEAEENTRLLAIGGVVGILVSLGVTFLAHRSIVTPIRGVTDAMKQVASGETAHTVLYAHRRDEIGQMLDAIATFRNKIERDNAILNERERELRLQNNRFDAALNNMTHGLAMFDRDRALIVCNKQYADMYNLRPELTDPGTRHEEIVRHLADSGLFAHSGMHEMLSGTATATQGNPTLSHFELNNGRCVVVIRQPMAGGGWLSTHEDVTERRRVEARIEHMARHDALTDLPNRVLFKEKLDEVSTRAQAGEMVAVLCLDLDRFKQVNDTLGHAVGDLLLKSVAARLRNCVRESDTVARLSGDEFAVIQQRVETAEDAAALAQRIMDVLAAPFLLDGHQVVVGASIGIALGPIDGPDADRLLKSADTAAYRAKSDGRGLYRFFEAGMDERLQARRATEIALREALSRGQFELFYQPLVKVRDRRISGFEALLRWRHPDRGLVSPGEFIPLAEEIGVIVQIGEWVLRTACAEAATWAGECHVAVNVSPAQFSNRNLVSVVTEALAASGLPPHRLELEITESVLLENSAAVTATLAQLNALGVRISMDDFGTGYSSLSYLQRFPFDKIKIDASFIHSLGQGEEGIAIVRAIAGLGKSLGITTTAEGVETEEQLESILAEGCDEVQGYYFSAPRPAKEVATFLRFWGGESPPDHSSIQSGVGRQGKVAAG